MNNEELIKSIKTLCKSHNIAISQLESKLNFSYGLVSRWSKSSPSLDKIVDIADYFHVTVDELIGRNIYKPTGTANPSDSDTFITVLMYFTLNKTLIWSQLESDGSMIIAEEKYKKLFKIKYSQFEIYTSKYNGAYVFLLAEYDDRYGKINIPSISLYIQPDDASTPVLQDYSGNELYELWCKIHSSIYGEPDELKSEKIKNQIIYSGAEALSNMHPEKSDNPMLSSDLLYFLKIFNEPKTIQAVNSAQRFLKYAERFYNKTLTDDEIENIINASYKNGHGDQLFDENWNPLVPDGSEGVTSKSRKFYEDNKDKLGNVQRIIGKNGSIVFLISSFRIMKLTGLGFGAHCGMTGYNGLLFILSQVGVDISDETLFLSENFDITIE